ncbi:MAG: hypothetical protein WDZ40_01105 [Candidatus Spechtbacterales bacterium]
MESEVKNIKEGIVFAAHNLMRGVWLDALIRYYKNLKEEEGLSVFCIQENVIQNGVAHIDKISRSLGANYKNYFFNEFPSPGIIYDSDMLDCVDQFSIKLPEKKEYSRMAKIVASEKRPMQRYAAVARLRMRGSEPFTVVSLHLTAFGGNKLRQRQMAAIQEELGKRDISKRLVICGDTNLFAWTKMMHRRAISSALKFFNVKDPLGHEPTYYFSRLYGKAKWIQKVPSWMGKIGIDMPRHYDIVASELPFFKYGKVTTPESDHDLVWARYDVS